MALTINRKAEISDKEFEFIKKKFKQNTNSQAIYACIKYMVDKAPNMENEIRQLCAVLEEITEKYETLIETIKKKQQLDNKFETIVFAQ